MDRIVLPHCRSPTITCGLLGSKMVSLSRWNVGTPAVSNVTYSPSEMWFVAYVQLLQRPPGPGADIWPFTIAGVVRCTQAVVPCAMAMKAGSLFIAADL